jgi:hypothetical protein
MSDAAKCGRIRGWMADAASGLLSDVRQSKFEKHIGECAACRSEFARIESLLERIDQSLRAELAVEPSPKLVLSVRESIAAETRSTQLTIGWLGRNSWLGASGVCTAVVALLIFVVAHRANRPAGNFAPRPQISNSAPAHVPVAPSRSASAESIPLRAPAHVREIKPRLAFARRESPRIPARQSSEPEVIVQPGQMQAILRFAAAMQRGQIDGAKLLADRTKAAGPLEIKPLTIAPLKIAALGENAASPVRIERQ